MSCQRPDRRGELGPPPDGPCTHCGAPAQAIDAEGSCTRCKMRQPRTRDHQETDLGAVAAVSDRGLRHRRNEDAYAIATAGDRFAVVVCDGVSSTPNPDDASAAAAEAAMALLEPVLAATDWPDDDILSAVMTEAVEAAGAAAAAVVSTEPDFRATYGHAANPSTTLVAALAGAGRVVAGSVGDSRVYWLTGDPARSRRLTVDDSWAEQAIAAGVPPEQAYSAPGAHVITRWLGADAESFTPTVVVATLEGTGQLVVCSDGLWNYFEDPATLDRVIAEGPADAPPLRVARHLVEAALAAGGSDNVTVAVIPQRPVEQE